MISLNLRLKFIIEELFLVKKKFIYTVRALNIIIVNNNNPFFSLPFLLLKLYLFLNLNSKFLINDYENFKI